MFAISWLDLRRLPVRVDATGLEAQYVGASILTDGVMLWFILDESGLHLRCRYPDTDEARRHVGRWLDRLVARLRELAQESVGGVLRVGGRRFRVQRAARADVAALVALLADDPIGAARESVDPPATRRRSTPSPATPRSSSRWCATRTDAIVATMQLSIVPGLSRGGATRLQIEGVRVAGPVRAHRTRHRDARVGPRPRPGPGRDPGPARPATPSASAPTGSTSGWATRPATSGSRRPCSAGQAPTYAARCSPVSVGLVATRSAGVPSKTTCPPS